MNTMNTPTLPEPELDEAALPLSADPSIVENEDGSATVELEEEEEVRVDPEFDANLAAGYLTEQELSTLGIDLCDLIKSDKTSREDRDKQYAEGIQRTGMGNDAPGGAEFEGSSKAVHPMLARGCVDFASRAVKELFPAAGPCKTQIIGESDDYKVDKAERKKTYMNWQLTTQVAENRAEFERLLSQLPLGGSQYKRWWWDYGLKRPRTETVYVDDVFLPYGQSDFYTSYRVTHRQWVSSKEYDARIYSGLYRDLNLSAPTTTDHSESQKASDKVEGAQEDTAAYNEEGLREIYQVYADLDLEDEGRTSPYIVHIDEYSQKVLAVYRNWAPEDEESRAKKHWMVEYAFIPWRGAYAVGLIHLIGSLSGSATGAIRALLDSAHINNFPGAVKLKGGRNAGQSKQVNATEITELEAPAGTDDIRKLVMPFPFNGPSTVLFSLLEWLTQQAESVIATASDKIADANANMPVGTALALIEHGSVNFSAIHARCHASLKREMDILHRLNKENIRDEETVEELGELVVAREDFQGPMDVIPVSDPNIFSEAQRYAQLQAVMQLADNPQFAPLFKRERLLQRALRLLQVSGPEDIANLPRDPKRMGALQENYTAASPEPSPLKVYNEQDDVAHLEAHVQFMLSPMLGANPLIGSAAYGSLMTHVRDHIMSLYRKHSQSAAHAMMVVAQMQGLQMTQDQAEAKGAAFAEQVMANLLGPMVMPAMEQMQKLAAQFAPKPPISPDVQAKIDADIKLAGLQQQGKMAELERTLPETQAERDLKIALKDHELAYQQERDNRDREQNDRATTFATALEKSQQDLQRWLTTFDAKRQEEREALAQAADADKQAQKASTDAMLMVLQDALTKQSAAMQQATAQQPTDLSAALSPLIEHIQSMTQMLMQGMQDLHKAQKAPRRARYVMDAKGNKIGVESFELPELPAPTNGEPA